MTHPESPNGNRKRGADSRPTTIGHPQKKPRVRTVVYIHEVTPYGLARGKALRVKNEIGLDVELSGRLVIGIQVPLPGQSGTTQRGTVAVLLEWGNWRLKPVMTARQLHQEVSDAFLQVELSPFGGDGEGLLMGASEKNVEIHLELGAQVRVAPFTLSPHVELHDDLSPMLVISLGSSSKYKLGLKTGHPKRNLELDAHLLIQVASLIPELWHEVPPCDTNWEQAPWVSNGAINPSDWAIDLSKKRTDHRLAELLPTIENPTEPGPPITEQFFKGLRLPGVDPVEQLRARGNDHRDLLETNPPGAYLVVAAHELLKRQKREGGDPMVFGDALTARGAELVLNRSAWTYRRLRETRDFVNAWIGYGGGRSSVNLPPAESPAREALLQLIQAAPWLTFLLTLHVAELTAPLTLTQVIEAAMIAPATASIGAGASVAERDVSALFGRVRLLDEVLDEATLGAYITAGSGASRRGRDAGEGIQRLTGTQRARFESVASSWSRMAKTTIRDLRVFVDPESGRGFILNLSAEGPMTIALRGEDPILLDPHRVTGAGHLIGSIDADIGKSDIGPIKLSINHTLVSLEYPLRPTIELDSGASQPRISSRLFQGREKELAQIMDMVRSGRLSRQPIVIYGNKRAGKTTLALHSLNRGVEEGLLTARIHLDVIDGAGAHGVRAEEYAPILSRRLKAEIQAAVQKTQVVLPTLEGTFENPVDLLQAVDRAWPDGEPPLGLLLDELDSLFYRAEGTVLHSLALQLGNLSLDNILLLGTVQRHNESLGILKEWLPVNCPASLGPTEAINYFTDALKTVETANAISRPMVTPWTLHHVVVPRLGFRPYFWGRLYRRLETEARLTGVTLIGAEVVNREIDEICRNDQFFGSLLGTDPQMMPLAEARRQDVFSYDEITLLAHFVDAPEHTNYLTLPHIRNAFGGDLGPLDSLNKREMIHEHAEQIHLDPPLLQEWVRLHALELAPFRRGLGPRMGPDQVVRDPDDLSG